MWWVCVCVCVLFSTPPSIYSREPPAAEPQTDVVSQQGSPCALVEAVGPTGLAGRPGRSVGLPGLPTTPTSWSGLVLVSPCSKVEARPAPAGFASVLGLRLVHLSLNRYSDIFCDFVSGQSVLVTCILAKVSWS